ncbi:acyl-CoA reductase [Paenibacillus pabuli]|uniref:acyl-CoA reductase n=1 Tax=Paenibacillus pabuli TaxID=1472 RepID=UPI003CE6B25E
MKTLRIFHPDQIDKKKLPQVLAEIQQKQLFKPFSPLIKTFIHEISQALLKDKDMRSFPEIISLAHWFRKYSIEILHLDFIDINRKKVVLPRGVILHLAPSNIDTIFVFSWFISLLMGNSNVIRVSSKGSASQQALLGKIIDILKKDMYLPIRERQCILTYEHDSDITRLLSKYCDTRVIWGGDQTIKKIRNVEIPPHATELIFPDRFSYSLLNAQAIINCKDECLKKLAENFYNDSYWFDQKACSSPKAVIWVGETNEVDKAQQYFWVALNNVISQKKHPISGASVIQQFSSLCLYASKSNVVDIINGQAKRVKVSKLTNELKDQHIGGGIFLELSVLSLEDVSALFQSKDQTLTVFGFEKNELNLIINSVAKRGIDRVVPVGKALNFSHIWDGFNLLDSFTREVHIEV